jgi:hypothetical protein
MTGRCADTQPPPRITTASLPAELRNDGKTRACPMQPFNATVPLRFSSEASTVCVKCAASREPII